MLTDYALDTIPRVIGKHDVSGRGDGLLCCDGEVFANACEPTGHDAHTPQSSSSFVDVDDILCVQVGRVTKLVSGHLSFAYCKLFACLLSLPLRL